VKELIENALDAAATRIDIEIRNGGKTEIRVADDGHGMSRDDALLCFDRHATSKIRVPDDLRVVRTLGFRGEALPSIASVSRTTLETAEQGGVGTRVRVAAGRVLGVEDCARQVGTTVVVRNLFVNVPARAKFLRSAAVETRAIVDVVQAHALARLSTAFRLESNGRALLELPFSRSVTFTRAFQRPAWSSGRMRRRRAHGESTCISKGGRSATANSCVPSNAPIERLCRMVRGRRSCSTSVSSPATWT
jgi:DNA mismatch repair protein MutL